MHVWRKISCFVSGSACTALVLVRVCHFTHTHRSRHTLEFITRTCWYLIRENQPCHTCNASYHRHGQVMAHIQGTLKCMRNVTDINICTYVRIHICMYLYIYIYIYIWILRHFFKYMCLCTYTCLNVNWFSNILNELSRPRISCSFALSRWMYCRTVLIDNCAL